MASVKVINKGYYEALKRFEAMNSELDVGVPDLDIPHKGSLGMTVAAVAAIHEYGAPAAGIPQRSYLRAWVDENEPRIQKMVAAMQQSVASGKRTQAQALELLGQKFVGEIQARIAKGIEPALKDRTVARKGSSKPLIDTGQLRSSITYIIRTKDEVKIGP